MWRFFTRRFTHYGSISLRRRYTTLRNALQRPLQREFSSFARFPRELRNDQARGTRTRGSSVSVIPWRPRRARDVRISSYPGSREDGEGVIEGHGRFEVVNRKATEKNQALTFLESESLSGVFPLDPGFIVGYGNEMNENDKRNHARGDYNV